MNAEFVYYQDQDAPPAQDDDNGPEIIDLTDITDLGGPIVQTDEQSG